MNLLTIDTSANFCAVCISDYKTGEEQARIVHDLGKGHAEYLIPIIQNVLKIAEVGYSDLVAVAVSVGPGSFTGIRVGLSAAKGFSLALDLPIIGISSLEAVAEELRFLKGKAIIMVAFKTRIDCLIQTAIFDENRKTLVAPCCLEKEEVQALEKKYQPCFVLGSAAERVASKKERFIALKQECDYADIAAYARLAQEKYKGSREKIEPLYLFNPAIKTQEINCTAKQK